MKKNIKAEYFNSKALGWNNREITEQEEFLKDFFTSEVKEINGNVLDLGCGTGILQPFILQLSSPGTISSSIDISFSMLQRFNESEKTFRVNSDAHILPIKTNTISNIFCYNTFPHFDKAYKVFDEMFRVLMPNGKVYIFHNMCHRQLNKMHAEKGNLIALDRMLPVDILSKEMLKYGFMLMTSREHKGYYYLTAKKK